MDEPGQAEITKIELVDPKGLTLIDYGVTPGPNYLLGDPGTLVDHEAGTDKIITVACNGFDDPESMATYQHAMGVV